jgi:hypothetical protein
LVYCPVGGKWEIALPNGVYDVRLVAGDPSFTSGRQQFSIEGTLAIDGVTNTAEPWLDRIITVPISDGRLSIAPGPQGSRGKICFIEIHSTGANG